MEWKNDKNFNILSKGTKGEKVKLLQKMLNSIEGPDITVDGYYGNETYNRIKQLYRMFNFNWRAQSRVDIVFLMNLILNIKEHNHSIFEMVPALHTSNVEVTKPKFVDFECSFKNVVNELMRRSHVPQSNLKLKRGIVIHHSYTNPKSGGSTPWGYATYHVQTKGWPCIGYDYVIDPIKKIIYKTAELRDKNYHTGGLNSRYYGICLTGNYDKTEMTDELYRMVATAFKLLTDEHIEATKNYKDYSWDPELKFHREFAKKSCPGDKFFKEGLKKHLDELNVKYIAK